MQHRAIKMIWGLQDLTYEERLKRTNWMSLEIRRYRADLLDVYRIMHGLDKLKPEDLFDMAQNSLRARAQLHLNEVRTQPDVMKIRILSEDGRPLEQAARCRSECYYHKCIQEPYCPHVKEENGTNYKPERTSRPYKPIH